MEEHELIERYLRGELSPEAKRDFEDRLAADHALREATELHQKALAAIRRGAREELKATLKNRWAPGTFNPKRPVYWPFWLAGGLLVLAGLWFWQSERQSDMPPQIPVNQLPPPDTTHRAQAPKTPNSTPPAPQQTEELFQQPNTEARKLYAANFTPYSSSELNILVRAFPENDPFSLFVKAYLAQDYKKALTQFDAQSEEDKNNENILFLKAMALLGDNQTSAALAILDKICSDKTSTYLPDAQWYAGLACLKKNDVKAAKRYFKEIVNSKNGNHPYAGQAKDLLLNPLLK